MKIDDLSKISYISNINRVNKTSQVKAEQNKDKIELSDEAKALAKAKGNLSSDRLAEIQKRIESNFYDKDEVLDVVADQILKSPYFLIGQQGENLDTNV